MISIIPWWGRILAIAALATALCGYGWLKGREGAEKQLAVFQARVEAAGQAQGAHTAQVIKTQKGITDEISTDYAGKLAALRTHYVAGVPVPRPGGGIVPTLSCAPAVADAGTPNPVPVAAVSQADFDELAGRAAETTLMLVGLQAWVSGQMKTR